MEELCRKSGVHCEGGNLAEWRVYNLHPASSKVKPKQGYKSNWYLKLYLNGLTSANFCAYGPSQNVTNPPYDPVKDAAKDTK